MKFLVGAVAWLVVSMNGFAAEFGANLKITAENLKFNLQPVQGAVELKCEHRLVNEAAQDWEVLCKDSGGKVKNKYSAHLWVSRYSHNAGPKVSFEVLYWIDDRSAPKDPKSVGSTTWFHMNEDTSLHSLQINQFVDNGQASLEMEVKAKHAD